MSIVAKRALVTGASVGLGGEVEEAGRRGFALVLTARSAAPTETLAQNIRRQSASK